MLSRIFQQFVYLKDDLLRWRPNSLRMFFYNIFEQGVWAVIFYRLGRALYLINIPVLRIVLRLAAFILHKIVHIILGVSLNPVTDIGPGLYIGHTGALIIHPHARIGRNLNIGTGVIIGERGQGKGGYPVIKDDVFIGVGAKVLGDITIGNRARIGANAVVLKDVPDGGVAVGIPARIISREENKE